MKKKMSLGYLKKLFLKDTYLPYLCDYILLSQKKLSHGNVLVLLQVFNYVHTSMCISISEMFKENTVKN